MILLCVLLGISTLGFALCALGWMYAHQALTALLKCDADEFESVKSIYRSKP